MFIKEIPASELMKGETIVLPRGRSVVTTSDPFEFGSSWAVNVAPYDEIMRLPGTVRVEIVE